MIDRATFHIEEVALLSALWYSDGSGYVGRGVGIEGSDEGWEIVNIVKLGTGLIRFDIIRKGVEDHEHAV